MKRAEIWILALIPIFIATWVWLSPLAFVPVPWPDDSAFYFAAKALFHWPPRYVMLPEAPFEPTYAIFSFNIMPAFPLLLGIGKWLGIDGSFALKFWSLLFWGLSGSALAFALASKKLPMLFSLIAVLFLAFDPIARWGAVIVRPESVVGLIGTLIVLGLTFGLPLRFRARGLWDPVAALLAVAAYFHYNAIHLIVPVVVAYAFRETLQGFLRAMIRIGWLTFLYISPWLLVIATHLSLFLKQMPMQWARLSVPNDWLSTPSRAIDTIMQAMGSPEPWPDRLQWGGAALWVLIFTAIFLGLLLPLILRIQNRFEKISLAPAAAWVISSCWLWNSKPEVWFVYYIHVALACFVAVVLAKTWLENRRSLCIAFATGVTCIVVLFANVDITQAARLGSTDTWHWDRYQSWIDCVDQQLVQLQKTSGTADDQFQVWGPTFPDILIELSRRHPTWILTRTNDFSERVPLAIQHGHEVDAVVTTEMLNWPERTISGAMKDYPNISSVWMSWKEYYLNRFYADPTWKPHRYLCQRGRWQAFIFMK